MRPTLEARGLKESLLQYLSTTYALTDEGARRALESFLGSDASGMFRGPFLRIRTPFAKAEGSWRAGLDWAPDTFAPYRHQAIAFERLSSFNGHTPQPTLVTTGTGSGKTESFLIPVLDHCRREKKHNRHGIKAVLLYPMNALATDQAIRLNDYLRQDALKDVTAGLFIGDTPATGYERVLTKRTEMRMFPPDILITNYKMLDLLLQRGDDVSLWNGADIRYVVVDEFHTYDGAQGTDVAMLLRRLAARVGASEPGRPLGRICPVATSATLASRNEGSAGSGDRNGMETITGATAAGAGARDLLNVATRVFGVDFAPDSIVAEDRLSVEQFIPKGEFRAELPLPGPEEIWSLPDPAHSPEAFAALATKVIGELPDGEVLDPFLLGAALKRHVLTKAVLMALSSGVKTPDEVLAVMWREGAYSWGRAIADRHPLAPQALGRFIALLSVARDPESSLERPQPLVHVEVHQWARSVSRLLRGVLPWPKAEFRWDADDLTDANGVDAARGAPATTVTSGAEANVYLPAVYCRDCGRSGWAVFSPESDDFDVEFDARKIRRASTSQDKIRVRNLIAATDLEARDGAGLGPMQASARTARGMTAPVSNGKGGKTAKNSDGGSAGAGGVVMVLDGVSGRLRAPDRGRDFAPATHEPSLAVRDSAFVLVHLGDTANTAAREDWCPACGSRNAIRYLGTGPAALAAASVTQLFTDSELDPAQHERKTLMFSDSVQDAAHRAGFVASRSYTFSLRALLAEQLDAEQPIALNDLIANVVGATTDPQTLAAVVPPDLHDHAGVARLLSGTGHGGDQKTWLLVGERLAFATLMEFGLRSRQGRTLELTRTAAAFVQIPDPTGAAALVRAVHLNDNARGLPPVRQDDARYLAFLRVFLERLRSRGAIRHRWLDGYLKESGTSRYFIWGARPEGMPAFPKGVAAPSFLLGQKKDGSEFDVATGRLAWYERWAGRCLELPREQSPDFWGRLLPELVRAGLLSVRTAPDGATRIYGLQPGGISAFLLEDEQVNAASVRCPVCFWEQTVHPSLLDQWHGQPCPSYRCKIGRLQAGDRVDDRDVQRFRDRDYREDYYRRLYRRAGTYQIITAEHTGMLTRAQREKTEAAFRRGTGFKDPNVLACTPTLELGIDIGDLSAVVLASLPRTPASYAQRIGRAGRRTGNAFLLTIPDRRRRDLYFLDKPRDMIEGRIVPPGCYLSAVEILRRQYLAHLLDLASAGRLTVNDPGDGSAVTQRTLRPLPRKAHALFGTSGYLGDLLEAALSQGENLVAGFLELFPSGENGVSHEAAEELREFATKGLRDAVEDAEHEWNLRKDLLHTRLATIDEALTELSDADEDEATQKAEMDAERRGVGRLLGKLGDADAQGMLTELGLLPNYALIDTRTVLEATLYWPSSVNEAGKAFYTSELREYERPRRFAIAELAPGNTFYVNGYRHEITGLEIGTRDHRSWQSWRICPGCGYVRTENAHLDRTPCPRCRGAAIADDGCLHNVVEPSRMTSRDKREDARIRDDRDERDPRFYEIADAVDMPVDTITTAWRHADPSVVFGIDFSRRAVIRKMNLGPKRFDIPATDEFAGNTVRISPFHVCTGCGAATANGKPVFDHDTDEVTSSAAKDPKLKHHRPWCPLRRGKKTGPDGQPSAEQIPILLAHQLQTEAIRVLLPAATVLVEEKVHSFRAALRLGVDRHFGGDPAHLDTAIATMADQATGEQRSFLVLYDTLPGGTGYLHRLTDPAAFRDVLLDARNLLLDCECGTDGQGRRACHRCLRLYTPERFQDVVSRQEALDLIEALLFDHGGDDNWKTVPIAQTGEIGLDPQIESDLEARFLATLRAWAARTPDVVLDEDSRRSADLWITTGDGAVHWRLTAQQRLGDIRTDFTFTRADGPGDSVKVFLDGHRYHASGEHNRLVDDAAKRTRLRAERHVVYQLTWYDLNLFDGRSDRTAPVWPPYPSSAQGQAKNVYEQFGGSRAEFDEVFTDPFSMLLAYLREPDRDTWARRARAVVAALVGMPGTVPVVSTGNRRELATGLRAALSASPSGAVKSLGAPGAGPVHVFASRDVNTLRILVALDAADPEALRWSAIAVLDDDASVLDTDDHRQAWRAWLVWSNIIQFLSRAGGDGVQLAGSQAPSYPVEALTVCGGLGELDSLIGAAAPDVQPPTNHGMARDAAWDTDVLPYLDEEETGLVSLARKIADAGRAAPVGGYELGDSGWMAEMAWPNHKIAVVLDAGATDDEVRRRDAAYTAAGWTVCRVPDWTDRLDALLELIDGAPDVEGSK